jgi:hypothetical protein
MSEIKSTLSKKTNMQLVEIRHFDKAKFSKEALLLTDHILSERKVTDDDAVDLKIKIRRNRAKEKRRLASLERDSKGWRGCLNFLLDLFSSGGN